MVSGGRSRNLNFTLTSLLRNARVTRLAPTEVRECGPANSGRMKVRTRTAAPNTLRRRFYWAEFVAEFIRQPGTTAALLPSSSYLARVMVQQAGLADADAVLEYGPGTGVFTPYILRELRPDSKFAAIEINPRFASLFRTLHPGVTLFEDSVENVVALCASMQVAAVDCVISGLPWALFPKSRQITILDQTMRVLKRGGRFITFAYPQSMVLPAAKHLAALLPNYFTTVSKSPIVWLNVPPAFVYRCVR